MSGILKLRQEGEIPIENFSNCQLVKYKQKKKVLRLKIQEVGKGLQFTEKG